MELKQRILLKLDEMKRYLHELEQILPLEKEYYSNLLKRRACEKTVELAIECVIEIISFIVAQEKLGLPEDEDSLVSLLGKEGLLSPALQKKIRLMKGFRNILVHKYGTLDDRKVYSYLKKERSDFKAFEREVQSYLQNS